MTNGRYTIDDIADEYADTHSTWYNDDDIALRSKAVAKVSLWASTDYSFPSFPYSQDKLAQLLGYEHYHRMLVEWNDDTRKKLEMLVGPHGYAVYKAMLARKEA